jgi:hypothetical protein
MSSSVFHDEYIISFLSQPIPIFNSIQKELLNNERQLIMKTHLAFNSICNELLIELIQDELENIIEKEDEIKSWESMSQISKSNSSIHSIDTSIDFKDRYGLREKRKVNYLETNSDNEEDLIPLTDNSSLDWISHLKRIPEFNSKCVGVQSSCEIPANTILGFYEGKYVGKLQEARKILRGPRPHYIPIPRYDR